VSASRLTTDETIEAVGESSGGEVEFVLLQHAGKLWVGTGSDHTDREVEKFGVTVSKQMCDKPIAPVFWAYDDVAPPLGSPHPALRMWSKRQAHALPGRRGQRDDPPTGPARAPYGIDRRA